MDLWIAASKMKIVMSSSKSLQELEQDVTGETRVQLNKFKSEHATLLARVKELEVSLDNARRELVAHREKARGNYWAWQGDGQDHLESLSTQCPVLISAEQFQAQLHQRDTEVESLRKAEGAMCAKIDLLNDKVHRLDAALNAAREALAEKNAALHRCKCIYCGLETPFEDQDKLADHIMSCEKSPVVKMVKEMESRAVDYMDLMNDEFLRISNLSKDPEIVGICQRAMTVIAQKEPVIKQRDDALKSLHQRDMALVVAREALEKWKAYFQANIPNTAEQMEEQGEQFTEAWFSTDRALYQIQAVKP